MSKTWCILMAMCMVAASCTAETPTHRAIRYASRAWNDSLRVVDGQYHDSPMVLKIRRFSCVCDTQLQYEAQIYGSWRPVLLVGDEAKLRVLQRQMENLPDGISQEAAILLTDKVYVSTSGLLFYTLYYVGNAG